MFQGHLKELQAPLFKSQQQLFISYILLDIIAVIVALDLF